MTSQHQHIPHSKQPDASGRFPRLIALYFPCLLVYLEAVLHLYMGRSLLYLPVYLAFSLSAGCLVSLAVTLFPRRVNQVVCVVLTLLFCLVFGAELIAKKILQSYYPLSTLGLAAGNRLTDYTSVVLSALWTHLPILLVLFLPLILLLIFGRKFFGFAPLPRRFSGLLLAGAVAFHLLGLAVVHLPWQGDLTPRQLYYMDTNMDDQVEQLGLITMLRLDVKHMIVPARLALDDDFSDLGNLGGSSSCVSSNHGGSKALKNKFSRHVGLFSRSSFSCARAHAPGARTGTKIYQSLPDQNLKIIGLNGACVERRPLKPSARLGFCNQIFQHLAASTPLFPGGAMRTAAGPQTDSA